MGEFFVFVMIGFDKGDIEMRDEVDFFRFCLGDFWGEIILDFDEVL